MMKPDKFYSKSRLLARLKVRTIIIDNHWLWTGKITVNGRGVMQVGGVKGKDIEVHRLSAFIHHNLELKDNNQHALHKISCRYMHCWNPDCLYVWTHQDNMKDIEKLSNFRCGHPKLGNSSVRSTGKVQCLICKRLTLKRYRLNKQQKQTEVTN